MAAPPTHHRIKQHTRFQEKTNLSSAFHFRAPMKHAQTDDDHRSPACESNCMQSAMFPKTTACLGGRVRVLRPLLCDAGHEH